MASLTSLPPKMQGTNSSISPQALKQTTIDLVGGIRCNICQVTSANKKDYDAHYVTHGSGTEIIYTCNICYKEFAGYPSFRGHCYTNHVIKERFRCEHCTKRFSKLITLKEHINIMHKFKCSSCNKEFPSKKEMQLHDIIHNNTDKPPYSCNTCETDMDTVDECKDHVEMHSEYLYSCPICNECIPNEEHAADHFKTHFGDDLKEEEEVIDKGIWKTSEDTFLEQLGGIFCEFCSAVLKNRVEFDAHFSCEHGDEDIVYMCVMCGKTFEKYSVFYNHCYNHTSKKRYECDICQKSFPRMSLLSIHRAVCELAGAENAKPFACTLCERRFATEGRWREHLRERHGLRELPCPHRGCDQLFDTPKQLMLHQQSHDDTIRHFCSQCRHSLANATICERHMEMHKKKIYFCPVCKRNYKEKYLIMNHLSQHFETVLHLCKVCGKMYNARSRLLEHMKSHVVVKTHSCTVCDKSFSKQYQLSEHMNTHTGSKPYQCPICLKSFACSPNWYKHVRRMHQEESIHIKSPIMKTDEPKEGVGELKEAVEQPNEDDEPTSNKNNNDETPKQEQIPNEQMPNADPIANIELSDSADCLGDINEANASIDFSNVRLETYIFSVVNDDHEVNIPSMKDEINLFNANCNQSSPIEAIQFDQNDNAAMDRNMFNENNGENILLEFSDNAMESAPVSKDPFQASAETAEPVDILEYIAEMPENNNIFIPVTPQDPLAPNAVQTPVDLNFPCEYGPEFTSCLDGGLDAGLNACAGSIVNLDDHMMPHIDPLLTIKSQMSKPDEQSGAGEYGGAGEYAGYECTGYGGYAGYGVSVAADYDNVPKWEPIITKLYDERAYGYGDMNDSNRLSIMNTDIF